MSHLVEIDMTEHLFDLLRRGIITEEDIAKRDLQVHRGWYHMGPELGPPGQRKLLVQLTIEHYALEDAFVRTLGIRKWRHISVSVAGALAVRLADQRAIGRQRSPGERGPAPLPDWYELTHLTYVHAVDFGFDPSNAMWQYLPGRNEPGLNIAEALHLRQPA